MRDLHLVTVPQAGIAADLLIGAGCVATVETAAVSLGELGNAPRFSAAVENGDVAIRDSTCPAIHAALQAAEKGVPFMPLRGLIGSDLLRVRPDWQVIDNPLADGGGDPIVVLPALRPDVALFHAPYADEHGNVWLGARRELVTMAHAAREALVTVEEVRPGDLLADEAAGGGHAARALRHRRSPKPRKAPGPSASPAATSRTASTWPSTPGSRRAKRVSRSIAGKI